MRKIKTFLTDSQSGYVLSIFLSLVNLDLNVVIKKGVYPSLPDAFQGQCFPGNDWCDRFNLYNLQ